MITSPVLLLSLILGNTELAKVAYEDDFQCLYKNIHYEASGESDKGKVFVGLVTKNRVESTQYSNNYCGVVYAPYQFSWTADKTKAHKRVKLSNTIEVEDFKHTLRIAYMIYKGEIVDSTGGSMYYYNYKKVSPKWAKAMVPVKVEGEHIFLVHN